MMTASSTYTLLLFLLLLLLLFLVPSVVKIPSFKSYHNLKQNSWMVKGPGQCQLKLKAKAQVLGIAPLNM